jgi:hypothetical protein
MNFKKWWYSEREDRIEKDTSQDMSPTNGDAVITAIVFICVAIVLVASSLIRGEH